ncbi:MAG TPA: hypothetical protein VFU23_02120 [Gemmatimonadales bacterium]|nr:hypothetical protein [Gemmatimonadales bacterium]
MSLGRRRRGRLWGVLLLLAAACGYVTSTSADSSLNVSFYGVAPTLLPSVVELRVQTAHRSYLWVGGPTATAGNPQNFEPVGVQAGDSLTAVAILRTPLGVEVTRATTGLRLESHWLYGLGFQAGGINPDATGFCHRPPVRVAITGFPGDTLFLWSIALPEDAVC